MTQEQSREGSSRSAPPAVNGALARRIVEDSIRTYFRKRRSRVPQFVDETYSVRGALKLHQHAFGHDLWRAPLNAMLAGPQIGLNATASVLARMGHARQARALRARELFFRTTVAQQLERSIVVNLLELPYSGLGEPSFRDALAIEIGVAGRLLGGELARQAHLLVLEVGDDGAGMVELLSRGGLRQLGDDVALVDGSAGCDLEDGDIAGRRRHGVVDAAAERDEDPMARDPHRHHAEKAPCRRAGDQEAQ